MEKAKEIGYYAEKKDEEVNLVDTIVTLYKLLSSKEDLFMLLWIIFLLSISFYLDLESQLLTGQVMGIIPTVFMNKDKNRKFVLLVNLYILFMGSQQPILKLRIVNFFSQNLEF